MPSYYQSDDLPKFAEISEGAPELWEHFQRWYSALFEDGELSSREKALIALAVAHSEQCPYCIDAYTKSALEQGSNLGEMTEAIHVAGAIRAGATLIHGLQMKQKHDKISI